jgi:hypothetical protein
MSYPQVKDTAIHEAGHAVLGILCGIGIDYIDVRPNAYGSLGFSSNLPSPYLESQPTVDNGRKSTRTSIPRGPHAFESPIFDALIARAFSALGGYVAEQSLTHLCRERRNLQSAHDAEGAIKEIMYAAQVIPKGPEGGGEFHVTPSPGVTERVRLMLRRAEECFAENRDVIDALASALAKAGRLETADIHRIVIEAIVARAVSLRKREAVTRGRNHPIDESQRRADQMKLRKPGSKGRVGRQNKKQEGEDVTFADVK